MKIEVNVSENLSHFCKLNNIEDISQLAEKLIEEALLTRIYGKPLKKVNKPLEQLKNDIKKDVGLYDE